MDHVSTRGICSRLIQSKKSIYVTSDIRNTINNFLHIYVCLVLGWYSTSNDGINVMELSKAGCVHS